LKISFQDLRQEHTSRRQPGQYENRQRSVKQFAPWKNNYAVQWRVPDEIWNKVPRGLQQEEEFKFVRYSAATCDPKDYTKNGYDLRQGMVAHGFRQVELFIAITMYDEDDVLLARTLNGVFENIRHIENQPGWSRSSWKNIVVCVIADGVGKLNPRAAALLAALGVYQPTARAGRIPQMGNRSEWKDTVAHIYEV
jgi:chitin synthase